MNLLEQLEKQCLDEFETGFVILPFFEISYILKEENYGKIKKSIKDTLENVKDRWCLHKVAGIQKLEFHNFAVSEIGYKAGKKGSKDKLNELLSVYGNKGNKIYNIKYSHSWDRIDENDKETVLGIIKEYKIWQS